MTLRLKSDVKRCLRLTQTLATLCALLPFIGISPLAFSTVEKPVTAILLSARGDLSDPYFADSVVLVMNNLAQAPVGIIVNRPTQVSVAQLFPDLKRLGRLHEKVYFGGPVDIESVWFLFRASTPHEHAIQAVDGLYLSADRALLLQLLGRDKPMDGLRVFVGHAEWAPGQLEAEIDAGAWDAKRADADAIFNSKTAHPWPGSDLPNHSA